MKEESASKETSSGSPGGFVPPTVPDLPIPTLPVPKKEPAANPAAEPIKLEAASTAVPVQPSQPKQITLSALSLVPAKLGCEFNASSETDLWIFVEKLVAGKPVEVLNNLVAECKVKRGFIPLEKLKLPREETIRLKLTPVDTAEHKNPVGNPVETVFHFTKDGALMGGEAKPAEALPADLRRTSNPEVIEELEAARLGRPIGSTEEEELAASVSTTRHRPTTRVENTSPWQGWLIALIAILFALVILSATLPVKEWASRAQAPEQTSGTIPKGSFTVDDEPQQRPIPTRYIPVPTVSAQSSENNYGGMAQNTITISGNDNNISGPLIVEEFNGKGPVKTNVDICIPGNGQTNMPPLTDTQPRYVTPPLSYGNDGPTIYTPDTYVGNGRIIIYRYGDDYDYFKQGRQPDRFPAQHRSPPPQNQHRGGGQPSRGIRK